MLAQMKWGMVPMMMDLPTFRDELYPIVTCGLKLALAFHVHLREDLSDCPVTLHAPTKHISVTRMATQGMKQGVPRETTIHVTGPTNQL